MHTSNSSGRKCFPAAFHEHHFVKKIEEFEVRRPDGMGTLISGTYSYNYIHGFEYHAFEKYPLLESLIFLCVLPLFQSNPNVTSSEREVAFNFLSSVRRDFLTSFAASLQHIYQHKNILNIAVRIHYSEDTKDASILTEEDETICNGLQELSQTMKQRMHGNYESKFDFLIDDDNDKNNNISEECKHGFVPVSSYPHVNDLNVQSTEDKGTQLSNA